MQLIRLENKKEFVESAIDLIKKIIEETDEVCRIALSGGSTPKPIYEALSQHDIDFSKVEFYQVDERYVPNEDENSNYKLINQSLINPLGDNLKAFHYFDTTFPIDQCIKKYSEEIKDINFDLVVLGMGTDGHIASIFPGDEKAINSEYQAIHTQTDQFAIKDRLTISLKKIKESKNTILLLKGKNKQDILNRLIKEEPHTINFPAQSLLTKKNFLILFKP